MFAIMLLPFPLFEIPLGKLADRKLGEKEILMTGFIVAGLSTVVILFISRVGASAIEIMTESYFFKHVDGKDTDTISLFRILRPLGYIIGPLLGGVALIFINIKMIFLIPGFMLLLGVLPAFGIKDTK